MAKLITVGVSSIAKKVPKAYFGGIDNLAHKIKKGYIGDENNIARIFYASTYKWNRYVLNKTPRMTSSSNYLGNYADTHVMESISRLIPIAAGRSSRIIYPKHTASVSLVESTTYGDMLAVSSSGTIGSLSTSTYDYYFGAGNQVSRDGFVIFNVESYSIKMIDQETDDNYPSYDARITANIISDANGYAYESTSGQCRARSMLHFYSTRQDPAYPMVYKVYAKHYKIEYSYSQGSFIDVIENENPNAFPANGMSGDYWYVRQ